MVASFPTLYPFAGVALSNFLVEMTENVLSQGKYTVANRSIADVL